jgi:phospholipase C
MGSGPHIAMNRRVRMGSAAAIAAAAAVGIAFAVAPSSSAAPAATTTPIQHLVVIVDSGVSFDHYFGTYPYVTNSDGHYFKASSSTPKVSTALYSKWTQVTKKFKSPAGVIGTLLTDNPNQYNPQRLGYNEVLTCAQNDGYTAEQDAVDNGHDDQYVENQLTPDCGRADLSPASRPGVVMDYYDGNTVTALWNYAQHYAMSVANYDSTYGPSELGAINMIGGDTEGGYAVSPTSTSTVASSDAVSPLAGGTGTIYGDIDPAFDNCSDASHTTGTPLGVLTGLNVGNLLNDKDVTWGWFQGGFASTGTNSAGYAVCGSRHTNLAGASVQDYTPDLDPFQYYQSTANPKHLPPTSEAAIGTSDQANHQYDLSDFYQTLKDGNMPAVSFLAAPAYENGNSGSSDPIDEQKFLVNTINQIEQSPDWASTAIVVTYDGSGVWYDSATPPNVNGSDAPQDGTVCAKSASLGSATNRCGYGVRVPLLVISPYAQPNTIDTTTTDTSSILRFIEDNWVSGQRISAASFDSIAGNLAGTPAVPNGAAAIPGLLNFTAAPQTGTVILNPSTGEVTGG